MATHLKHVPRHVPHLLQRLLVRGGPGGRAGANAVVSSRAPQGRRPRRFADLRVGAKIVGISLVVASIFATIAAIGLVHSRQLAAQQDYQYRHNVVALSHMSKAREALAAQQQAVLAHVLSDPGFYRESYAQVIADTDNTLTAELGALDELDLTPVKRDRLELVEALLPAWRGARDAALEASRLGDRRRATSILLVRSEAIAQALRTRADAFHADLVEAVAAAAMEAQARSRATAGLMLALLIAGGLVAVTLSVVVARTISRPLRQAVDVLAGVGVGDFSRRLEVSSQDEVGQMARSLNTTLIALDHAFASIRHQALHDSLTGLANRSLFHERVELALHKAERGVMVALLLIDLDDFKAVNDRYGHDAGDALLSAVGRRLQQNVRAGDTAARLGGDELAVLLEGIEGPDEAYDIAERILHAIHRPVTVSKATIHPRASIGVVPWHHHTRVDDFLRDADAAMYAAKTAGRGRVSGR